MGSYIDNLPYVLDDFEVESILSEFDKSYPCGIRNFCIVKLFLETGIKAEEFHRLKWEDLDMTDGYLLIRNTNMNDIHRRRELVISYDLLDDLRDYKFRMSNRGVGSEWMFTTLEGNKIGNRYVRDMLARYGDRAMIAEPLNIKILRNTFAVRFLNRGNDIKELASVMGYSTHDSKVIYRYRAMAKANEMGMIY